MSPIDTAADAWVKTLIAGWSVGIVVALIAVKPPALLRDGLGYVPAYGRSG